MTIKLTASSPVKTLVIELPARAVTLHGIDLEPSMLDGARYRNWTDGERGVIACQLPGSAMDVDPEGRTG